MKMIKTHIKIMNEVGLQQPSFFDTPLRLRSRRGFAYSLIFRCVTQRALDLFVDLVEETAQCTVNVFFRDLVES